MKWRKKPVVIDAILWDGTAQTFGLIQEMGCPFRSGEMGSKSFFIPTLEGDMKVTDGDWVIRGVKGEFYPCKPDIFEKTYELAEESPIKEDGEDELWEAFHEIIQYMGIRYAQTQFNLSKKDSFSYRKTPNQ